MVSVYVQASTMLVVDNWLSSGGRLASDPLSRPTPWLDAHVIIACYCLSQLSGEVILRTIFTTISLPRVLRMDNKFMFFDRLDLDKKTSHHYMQAMPLSIPESFISNTAGQPLLDGEEQIPS